MTVIQVGLVDMTGKLDADLVSAAAIAINLQVTRDLPQFWPVSASVVYLPNHQKIPAGIWPVQLVKTLPPDEGGFHADKHKQPYAKVIAAPGDSTWTIDASHEILEMLVDPYGNRMQSSVAIELTAAGKIVDGTGQFGYLVEACDPCEANDYAYTINGVMVSDFITPRFYDPLTTTGTRYSFTGAIPAPRQVLPGGYISWVNTAEDEWQQLMYVDPTQKPFIQNIGQADSGKSLREWIDSKVPTTKITRDSRTRKTPKADELVEYSVERMRAMDSLSVKNADLYDKVPAGRH